MKRILGITFAVLLAASGYAQLSVGAGGQVTLAVGTLNASTTVNGQECTLGSSCTVHDATVGNLNGVPFCTGYTPVNGQVVQYTTASSPNPCYTATTISGGGGSGTVNSGSGYAIPMYANSAGTTLSPSFAVFDSLGESLTVAGDLQAQNTNLASLALSSAGSPVLNVYGASGAQLASFKDSAGDEVASIVNDGTVDAAAYKVGGVPLSSTNLSDSSSLVKSSSALSGSAGAAVCDDGTGKVKDTGCPTSTANTRITFSATAGTAVTFTHNLASSAITSNCYDGSGNEIVPTYLTLTSTNVATAAFSVGSGACVFSASSSAGVTGGEFIQTQVLPVSICQGTTAGTGFSLPVNNAPVPYCVTGTYTNLGSLHFASAIGSAQYAQYHFEMPSDLDCTQAFDVRLNWRAVSTSGNVAWNVQTMFAAAGTLVDQAFNTASSVTSTVPGTTLQLKSESLTGITATGCAASSELFLNIYRGSGDTMSGDAELVSAQVRYRRAM